MTTKKKEFISQDPATTRMIAEKIWIFSKKGDAVGLMGELGCGKTVFVQGLARGLNIEKNCHVSSPSYTIINEYPGPIPLYHFDLFRIGKTEDMEELGYEEYISGEGVTAIEWAEKILDFLPEDTFFVRLKETGENSRLIEIEGNKKRMEEIMDFLNC